MQQRMSVTEVRNNFPALIRQVAEQEEPIVVTSRNQPRVVLVAWERYQEQQADTQLAAQTKLSVIVASMIQMIDGLQEVYDAIALELQLATKDLLILARQGWKASRKLSETHTFLISLIADSLENLLESEEVISYEQLSTLAKILPLLEETTLTNEQVSSADISLLDAGLNALFPVDGDLSALYE